MYAQAHKTKLVHACTTASSSAMLKQHGSTHSTRATRSYRLARQSRTCRVVSRRPSGIWAYRSFNHSKWWRHI